MPLDIYRPGVNGPPPFMPEGEVPRPRWGQTVQPGTITPPATPNAQAATTNIPLEQFATTSTTPVPPGPNVKITDGAYTPGFVDPVQPKPPYPEPPGPGPVKPPYPEPGPVKPPYPENPVPGPGTPLSGYAPPGSQFSPGNVVTGNLNDLLSSGSRYIENARQRGREQAASRGLLNSSISAGAAERSGIEASMPILDQIMGLNNSREAMANASLEAQRDRQFQSEFATLDTQLQDWLHNSTYNREWNGQLAMLPIASAADMWSSLMQLAASDPTVFTPTVLAGYQDFFQNGFNEYISRYLQPATPGGT